MISTLIIIAIVIISIRGFQDEHFLEKYLFDTTRMGDGSGYYRLISSAFLHGSPAHLAFNCISFHSFAMMLEESGMTMQMVVIFFGSILGGGLLSWALHRNHEYRALGASGGVSGVIFATIFLFPGGGVSFILVPIPIPSWIFALLFMGISIWGVRSQKGNIGHDAHLGGALVGLLIATLFEPSIVTVSPVLYSVVWAVSLLFFVYLSRREGIQLIGLRTEKRGQLLKFPKKKKAPVKHITLTVDEVLRKVKESGLDSLSPAEKKLLEEGSEYYRTRGVKK